MATVTSVGALDAVMGAAVGAHDVTLLPTGVADGAKAAILGVEVFGNLDNRVEVGEVNHNESSFMSGIIIYSKHKGIFQ